MVVVVGVAAGPGQARQLVQPEAEDSALTGCLGLQQTGSRPAEALTDIDAAAAQYHTSCAGVAMP